MPLKPEAYQKILDGSLGLTDFYWFALTPEQRQEVQRAGLYDTWIEQRRQEKAKEEAKAAEQKAEKRRAKREAKASGLCNEWVRVRRPRGHSWTDQPEQRVCGEPIYHMSGKRCLRCYKRIELKFCDEQVGAGKKRRPFKYSQIPWGKLSKWQFRAFKKLPVRLSLDEVVKRLNAADKGNQIEAVTQKTSQKT